jgi:predicted Holliday junction resolvase-like endonuclease
LRNASFPDFPFDPRDCRALFEPIDYIVFQGLGKGEFVDALHFVEVKSGVRPRLSKRERGIKDVVSSGNVDFVVSEER